MDNPNAYKLPNFIYSHEQIGLYLLQLEHFKTTILKEKVKGTSNLGHGSKKPDSISGELEKYLLSTTPSEGITYDFIEKIYDFLKEVRENAPRLHLTFAATINESLKQDLTQWARQNIHEFSLISFHYDKGIVGGVIARTRNKIFDFSFSKKLLNPKVSAVSLVKK